MIEKLLLTTSDVDSEFDDGTLHRAGPYVGGLDRVVVGRHDHQLLVATAQAVGSGPFPYEVELVAIAHRGRTELTTTCSCPVSFQCKHGAALAMTLLAATVPGSGPDPADALQRLTQDLVGLTPPAQGEETLALQLTTVSGGHVGRRYASAPQIKVRPMRRGRRDNWIKSGIDWGDIPRALGEHRYRSDQLEALGAMHGALTSRRTYWYAGYTPSLGDFGPMVLRLLREARDAGVPFLLDEPLSRVTLLDVPLSLTADLSRSGSSTSLTLGIEHADRLWRGGAVQLIGSPAFAVALVGRDELTLASLTKPLDARAAGAFAREPILISDDAPLDELLLPLTRLVPLASHDGSATVPEPIHPRLRLTVEWHDATAADVAWTWRYGRRACALDDTRDQLGGLRDHGAEREVIAGLPSPPAPARRRVSGPDVVELALLELPAWRDCAGVEVVERDAPEFREAASAPEISFEAAPPEHESPEQATDWLDLTVLITVEGERVLLADLVAALTLDQEFLVLPSGLVVPLDRPEFAGLLDVVRAAGELHEVDGDTVRVGGHDLGLWAQLADLGVVDAQADAWISRAQALRDLVELPQTDPVGLATALRSYQLDGFRWLSFLWQHRLGGVLADDMGLGKTLQVLALIRHTREEAGTGPFLVVCPTSVVPAWASEAARHVPGLRVAAVDASARRREHSIAELAATHDVVVTSYTLLRLEQEAYHDVTWAGLVLDEAQQVKNHQSKTYAAVRLVEAPFRLVVTGTPFENRLLELWALLSIAAPGIYPHPKNFLDHVVKPVEKRGDEHALRRFTQRVKPFVLRRTKELVAADLPPKQEQVLALELSPRHRKVYDTHLAKERQRILGLADDFDRNRVAILAALTKLRQLALDPALVDPEHDRLGSVKIDALVDHLREIGAEGHRALVFSSFTGFLARVRHRLEAEGITTSYLDGGTQRRGEVIEDFRSGATDAFLISLKAGGVGLTLTEADYVFVLDPWWNPAAEAQAVDRAHRIGQTRTVMVYRLVATETIEDKVMALKDRKAALFAQVMDGEGSVGGAITADDVRALFA